MDIKVKDYLQKFGVSEATQRFLGKSQKMFVGGAWLESADSAEVIEPSTGGVLTRIPMGTADDLERAVQAARAQFDGGAWSQLKPLERERLLHGLADLIEANADELAEIESIDGTSTPTMRRGPGRPMGSGKRGPAPGPGRGRGGNKRSLPTLLHSLLRGKTMSVPEMADAAKKAGHKTKSKNFRTIVSLAIINNRNLFKRVARGQYTAK